MNKEYFRLTYNNIGIYEAFKKELVQKEGISKWNELKKSETFTWLKVPNNYEEGCRSYFTKIGYETFMNNTYPIMLDYLDKEKINIDYFVFDYNDLNIVYEDENQIVVKNRGNMIYRLEEANLENKNLLIEWKLNNIFEYANDLDKEEIDRINNYVIDNVTKEIDKYKLIMIDNKIIGCLLLINYEDGIMIDEIYIKKDYRCKGIGTSIIKNILKNNNIIYLWVYKNNIKALELYKRLLFSIEKETETRFLMKYTNV